jgi:hypothetical protein
VGESRREIGERHRDRDTFHLVIMRWAGWSTGGQRRSQRGPKASLGGECEKFSAAHVC